MKLTSRTIGASLMFSLTVGEKTRTDPPVQTLANLRRLVAAKQDEELQFQRAHQEAHRSIRAALRADLPTESAYAQVIDAERDINTSKAKIYELRDIVDQVTSAAIAHDGAALTKAWQLVIDQSLMPFDLSQFDTATESI